jgi:subtilisin
MRKPMSDPIYRLPPIKYGPKVYIASELGDIVDWGLRMQGVPENWVSQGEGVLVGVLDTGKPNHVDLGDAVKMAKNFSNSPTVDDRQSHSTHCSGIIAARKNNQGVVGVAPKAGLCIAKVLGDDGSGTSPGIAAGIRWCVSQGCDILSMSLGGAYDADIERAVNEAVAAGVFVICAAGNEGAHGENTVGYPGALSNVVTVAAYNKQGLISNFSSRGKQIELAAPGEDILSTVLSNQYQRMSGTSMATPFVAGLTAELIGRQRMAEKNGQKIENKLTNNQQLIARIAQFADDKGPAGRDTAWGYGVVDIKKFLEVKGTATPPVTPTPSPTPIPSTDTPLLGGLIMVRENVTIDGKTGFFVYMP